MKLHIVLMHLDGTSDPSYVVDVTYEGIEAAMDLALAHENMYEDDKAKWDPLVWEVDHLDLPTCTAPTNSSMGSYEIVTYELETEFDDVLALP